MLASIHLWNDWDWKAAEEELNIAAALEPNHPDFMGLAEQRNLKGEWRDAIRFCERSLALDPLSPLVYEPLGRHNCGLANTLKPKRRIGDWCPTYSFGYLELGESLLLQGKLEQALVEVSKERNPGARLAGMAFAWLTTAFEQKDVWLTGIKGDPLLKSLTGDARLTEFLRK